MPRPMHQAHPGLALSALLALSVTVGEARPSTAAVPTRAEPVHLMAPLHDAVFFWRAKRGADPWRALIRTRWRT